MHSKLRDLRILVICTVDMYLSKHVYLLYIVLGRQTGEFFIQTTLVLTRGRHGCPINIHSIVHSNYDSIQVYCVHTYTL